MNWERFSTFEPLSDCKVRWIWITHNPWHSTISDRLRTQCTTEASGRGCECPHSALRDLIDVQMTVRSHCSRMPRIPFGGASAIQTQWIFCVSRMKWKYSKCPSLDWIANKRNSWQNFKITTSLLIEIRNEMSMLFKATKKRAQFTWVRGWRHRNEWS